MATDNDVYELVHTSSQYGMDIDNVYYYQRGEGITANAQAMAEEWVEQVLPFIQDIRASDQVTTGVSVKNLFDPTDVFTSFMNEGGLSVPEQTLPPFAAVGFTLNRENATTNNGAKRYSTIAEGAQDDGILSEPTFLDRLADLAGGLVAPVVGTLAVEWFFPVIVGRIEELTGYRLPATAAEATVNAIIDAVFKPEVTSQNSRKYGNGA